jgi:hypothetical protein
MERKISSLDSESQIEYHKFAVWKEDQVSDSYDKTARRYSVTHMDNDVPFI